MIAVHWTDLVSTRYDTARTFPLTKWISQRLGSLIAALGFLLKLHPNVLTLIGAAFMLAGAWALVACQSNWEPLMLLQIGFAFDCADGQLARATGQQSRFGGWLDLACDHLRNSALAFAVTYMLLGSVDVPMKWGMLAGLSLAAGNAVCLHSMGIPPKEMDRRVFESKKNLLKYFVSALIDTPMYLTLLCVLRTSPTLLTFFSLGFGLFLLGSSVRRAWNRLK